MNNSANLVFPTTKQRTTSPLIIYEEEKWKMSSVDLCFTVNGRR